VGHTSSTIIQFTKSKHSYIDTPIVLNLDETVRKNLISQIPAGRLGKPEEVGNAIVFLASDLSSFMYGEGLVVDG